MNCLYSAFDVFPGSKGAAAHIGHTLESMSHFFDHVDLLCLGTREAPSFQQEGKIRIWRFRQFHPNFLIRTQHFYDHIISVLSRLDERPDVIQFRDIWSGRPLLAHPVTGKSKKIFEVNGLTSIELPMRYTRLFQNSKLLYHFNYLEKNCLNHAHKVVTVSNVNARCIQSLGIDREKIRVIPNQAYIPLSRQREPDPRRIFYMGTLAPWQGIHTLLESFALIRGTYGLNLSIAGSTRKFLKGVKKKVAKLGIGDYVTINVGLSKKQIRAELEKAYLSVAPLTRCDRNELQGCCPLKILESMAFGVPVVASDLPVTGELIDHNVDGYLVPPDSVRALAGGMAYLLENPHVKHSIAKQGIEKIKKNYSRELYNERFNGLYREVTGC